MKFTIATLLIAFISSITEFFSPWWTIAVVAFLISFVIKIKPGAAFLAGFLGVTLFWLPNIIFKDVQNGHILSQRMANLFHLPNSIVFICLSVFIGSLMGGLASFSGSLLRKDKA